MGKHEFFCTNKSFAFAEMEMIQFHLLVKTFADILINSKRKKWKNMLGCG